MLIAIKNFIKTVINSYKQSYAEGEKSAYESVVTKKKSKSGK